MDSAKSARFFSFSAWAENSTDQAGETYGFERKKILVGGIPTPLKNDGVSQLGWWNSQLNGKIIQMFQTTKQLFI